MTTEKEVLTWVRLILSILEEGGESDQSFLLEKLPAILKKRKKEYLLSKIAQKLDGVYLKENAIYLYLAKEHPQNTIRELEDKLLHFFGTKKKVVVKIESDLIGGFRAKTDNFLVKASVKDFLEELRNKYLPSGQQADASAPVII